jgi:hypothetical protein
LERAAMITLIYRLIVVLIIVLVLAVLSGH